MPKFKPILFNTEMVRAILEGRKTQTRRLLKPKFRPDEAGFQIITNAHTGEFVRVEYYDEHENETRWMPQPFEVGDTLWVRETWYDPDPERVYVPVLYKADFPIHWDADQTEHGEPVDLKAEDCRWKPSIHMPKGFARIFLRVKDVRVERLQSIGYFDSLNEGIAHLYDNLSDAEYENWASRSGYHGKKKSEWPYINYLWHGHFGSCGTGNRISDAWPYQFSSYEDPRGSFSSLWNSTVHLKDWDKYGWDANPWVWVIEFERIEKPDHWFLEVGKS